jgi:hypothetical protein
MSPAKSDKESTKKLSKDNIASSSDIDKILKKIEELTLAVNALSLGNKKVKRIITYNVPEDSNRCIEKKNDGDRCKGKLAKSSKKLCQLHLNKVNGIDPVAAKKAKKAKATA